MKLLKYLIIRLTTKGSDNAIKVYNTLYPAAPAETKYVEVPKYVRVPEPQSPVHVPNSPMKPVDKREELEESLTYLNNKKVKTKQDKESIEIIKSILKNMK
jgi:hypothetical protein